MGVAQVPLAKVGRHIAHGDAAVAIAPFIVVTNVMVQPRHPAHHHLAHQTDRLVDRGAHPGVRPELLKPGRTCPWGEPQPVLFVGKPNRHDAREPIESDRSEPEKVTGFIEEGRTLVACQSRHAIIIALTRAGLATTSTIAAVSAGSRPPRGEAIELDIDGRAVRVTNPDKVFFTKRGETKLDTIEYYRSVEGPLLAALGGRPTIMQRFPDGASGKSFFQKRVPKSAPDWLTTTIVSTVNGTTSDALVIADMAHVVWAVNQGVLGFHPWPYRVDAADQADELRLDLDPQPGTNFEMVRETAAETRALLDELGLVSYPKTTGSKGLHIHVRVAQGRTSYEVRAAAVVLARMLARRRPDLITDRWWKEERGERIFIDYNQNAPHKTVFGAWSVRSRVGGQVSTPFGWDELDTVSPEELTLANVPDRVRDFGDPWASIEDNRHDLAELIEQFHAHIAQGGHDEPWPPVYPKMPHEPPRVSPSRAAQQEPNPEP